MGIVWMIRVSRSLQEERPPVSEKLLRPAGESVRRELEKMDDQVNDILISSMGTGQMSNIIDSIDLTQYLNTSNDSTTDVI